MPCCWQDRILSPALDVTAVCRSCSIDPHAVGKGAELSAHVVQPACGPSHGLTLTTPLHTLTCTPPLLSRAQVVDADAPSHSTGRSIVVAALLDTATLWQYGGPVSNASTPLLVAQVVGLQAPAPPVSGLPLRQPNGAPPLQHGTRPRGFWNGAVSPGCDPFVFYRCDCSSDHGDPAFKQLAVPSSAGACTVIQHPTW